jgi:hypothetical protein
MSYKPQQGGQKGRFFAGGAGGTDAMASALSNFAGAYGMKNANGQMAALKAQAAAPAVPPLGVGGY